jgi:hypothetical protein
VNLFNRIVVLIILIAVGAVAISIAVLAWTIPDDTIDWLRDAVQWLDDNDGDTEKALLSAVGIAVAVVILILLFVELMPRATKDVRVTDLQGGQATLSTAAVAQRLEDAVRQLPNIGDAKAFVASRRKGVDVEMDLHVDPDANLAEVTNAANDTVRDVLSNRMHVGLATPPRTRLHYRELRLRRPGSLDPATTSSNSTVVPALPTTAEDEAAAGKDDKVVTGRTMPPRSEAAEAGWRDPASPDNTDAEPQADIDAPASEKAARPEPETEKRRINSNDPAYSARGRAHRPARADREHPLHR